MVINLLSKTCDDQKERALEVATTALTTDIPDTEAARSTASWKLEAAMRFASENAAGSLSPVSRHPAAAWQALPAPALLLIGSHMTSSCVASVRMVCKAWAAQLCEVLKEATPCPYPLLAHNVADKDGQDRCCCCYHDFAVSRAEVLAFTPCFDYLHSLPARLVLGVAGDMIEASCLSWTLTPMF